MMARYGSEGEKEIGGNAFVIFAIILAGFRVCAVVGCALVPILGFIPNDGSGFATPYNWVGVTLRMSKASEPRTDLSRNPPKKT